MVSTPIGNLADLSPRAADVLFNRADCILAEDTRRARRLLKDVSEGGLFPQSPEPSPALDAALRRLRAFHEFSPDSKREEVLDLLRSGQSVALISDAGTPLVSDPGASLVRESSAIKGVRVVPVPGCSAVHAALACSGLPVVPHTFLGFLPDGSHARVRRLEQFKGTGATLLAFVPPHDLVDVLHACVTVFGDSRRCCIAREMTKTHEEFWRGTMGEALAEIDAGAGSHGGEKQQRQQRFRGEICLVIDGMSRRDAELDLMPTEDELRAYLRSQMDGGVGVRNAVERATEDLGVRKKLAYKIALEIQAGMQEDSGPGRGAP